MSQLFLDLDGVLADFDAHYVALFGYKLPRHICDPPGMWDKIRSRPEFYAELPPMPDAVTLWNAVEHLNPIILTGVPYDEVPWAAEQKTYWVEKYFGRSTQIICCKSSEKRLHGKPGDILVDDWDRYRHLWLEMGGIFILHTSAEASIKALYETNKLR
jgi:hypothetical protein